METKQTKNATSTVRSFDLQVLRFTAFLHNLLFVSLLIFVLGIGGVILSGIVSLVFDNAGILPSLIISTFGVIAPVSVFLFLSFQTSHGRQTPGNKSMGLVVVDKDGNDLTFSKSLIRNLLWILSALPFGMGLIWAAFDSTGRGWHDKLLGTRVVRKKKDEVKISLLALVSFFLGLFSLFLFIFPLTNMVGWMSSLTIMWGSFIILFFFIPVTFILGVIARIVTRKTEKDLLGQRFGNYGIRLSLITGILFLLLAVAIPSNSNIYWLNQEAKCEEEIKEIAETIEGYIHNEGAYPENFKELVQNGYLEEVPTFRYQEEYIYTLEQDHEGKYFIITCPQPQSLLKGRGLLPPQKCLEIRYIQGKGLIVKTE